MSEYSDEVLWLIDQVESIVNRYEQGGVELAQPEMVVDHWEEVKFHSAIESNYIPLYASIWQGLFSVKTAVENEESIKEVRAKLANLEQIMWQSLGAVKLAAQYQEQGLLQKIKTREAITPTATLIEIKQRLDRVLAKYAEKLSDEAIKIVQEVYLNRFEGIEGVLIEQDAELVEDLEIDFNVQISVLSKIKSTFDKSWQSSLQEEILNNYKIEGYKELKTGKYVQVSISDSGSGITHQIIEKMFVPFYTTKKPGEGTGLGLSTVKLIVENHSGFIDFNNVSWARKKSFEDIIVYYQNTVSYTHLTLPTKA